MEGQLLQQHLLACTAHELEHLGTREAEAVLLQSAALALALGHPPHCARRRQPKVLRDHLQHQLERALLLLCIHGRHCLRRARVAAMRLQ